MSTSHGSALATSDKLHYNNVVYDIASAYSSGDGHIVVTNKTNGQPVPANVNYLINLDNTNSKLTTTHGSALATTDKLSYNGNTYDIASAYSSGDGHVVVTNKTNGQAVPGNVSYDINLDTTKSVLTGTHGSNLSVGDTLTKGGANYPLATAYTANTGSFVVTNTGLAAAQSGSYEVNKKSYSVNAIANASYLLSLSSALQGNLARGNDATFNNVVYTVERSVSAGATSVVVTKTAEDVAPPTNNSYNFSMTIMVAVLNQYSK